MRVKFWWSCRITHGNAHIVTKVRFEYTECDISERTRGIETSDASIKTICLDLNELLDITVTMMMKVMNMTDMIVMTLNTNPYLISLDDLSGR